MTNRPAYTLYVERYSHNAHNIEDGCNSSTVTLRQLLATTLDIAAKDTATTIAIPGTLPQLAGKSLPTQNTQAAATTDTFN